MAKNFRIKNNSSKNRSLLSLQLFGDFDGASADQLLNLLDRKISTVRHISIDTNGLRHIHAFGMDVFQPRIARVKTGRTQISVTGKFEDRFSNRRF